jgi:hypothetical protein
VPGQRSEREPLVAPRYPDTWHCSSPRTNFPKLRAAELLNRPKTTHTNIRVATRNVRSTKDEDKMNLNDPYGPVQGVHNGQIPGTVGTYGSWIDLPGGGIKVTEGPLSGQTLYPR